ncbi:hypothetical protein QTN25_008070 [Entamoeba marina]
MSLPPVHQKDKERSPATIKKLASIDSINKRILSFSWILIEGFRYKVTYDNIRRKATNTFPYYPILKITNSDNKDVFIENDVRNKLNGDCGKQITKYIQANLHETLIEQLQLNGCDVHSKNTKQQKSIQVKTKERYKYSFRKPKCIIYQNKIYSMNDIEKTIGEKAKNIIENCFKTKNVKRVLLYYGDGQVNCCPFFTVTFQSGPPIVTNYCNPFQSVKSIPSNTTNHSSGCSISLDDCELKRKITNIPKQIMSKSSETCIYTDKLYDNNSPSQDDSFKGCHNQNDTSSIKQYTDDSYDSNSIQTDFINFAKWHSKSESDSDQLNTCL